MLLLRVASGGVAGMHGGLYLADSMDPTLTAWLLGLAAIGGGIGLLAGFMTPAAAVAVTVATIVIEIMSARPASTLVVTEWLAAVLLVANAVAVGLLGGGAYSLDAYLFGRREIIISHERPHR